MALMMKDLLESDYVQVPNETAKAVQEKDNDSPISLEALGLIVNLWSYDVTKWEVRKTELYKRFAKNKKTSVMNAWDELVEANYIIEFKYRKGRKWEYVYIYRIKPFSKEEKEDRLAKCVDLAGVSSTSDFQHLKMGSSKCAVQNQQVSNIRDKQDNLKKTKTKEIQKELNPFDSEYNLNSNMPNIIDDEKDQEFRVNIFAFKEFVKEFEESFSNVFDNDMYNAIYQQMHTQRMRIITTKEAVNQARYMKQRQDEGKLQVGDYAAYFVGGIKKKRTSEQSALLQRKIDKMIKEQKAKNEREYRERIARGFRGETMYEGRPVPFYNWLES